MTITNLLTPAGDLVNSNDNKKILMTLDVMEIMQLIPHRYPMLLIDKLNIMELSQHAVGIKNVSLNEWYFEGHFPGKPIMPGVLIVEAMAQAAATLVMKSLQLEGADLNQKLVYFMSIENAKFRRPVVPGDVLHLNVEKEKSRGNVWRFKGGGLVEGKVASEASFTAMIVDR
jgi:3-hydroxyacyl-[acyl-carrier-protein] dehydratase